MTAAHPPAAWTGPLKRLRERLVTDMVAHGTAEADARHVVGQLGDGAILSFLLAHAGDIAALIKLLIHLIG